MYMLPESVRQVRRLRTAWRDDVAKDARVLGIRSWWAPAVNREEWRKFLSKAKELYDLYRRRRRWWWWSPHWYGSALFLFLTRTTATHTWFVPKVSVLIFLCTNWQCSTSLMFIGTLVVTLAACPYSFQLDWLSQSCATAVCVWSCFLTSLRLRCRKISNNGTLWNFVWNSTNLPQKHLLL